MQFTHTLYSFTNLLCTFCEIKSDNSEKNIDYGNIHICDLCKIELNISDDDDKLLTNRKIFKKIKSLQLKKKKINNQKIRENNLLKKLKKLKLEYKSNTLCDIYIKYGNIDIKTVIQSLEKESYEKSLNLMNLVKELKKNNVKYDNKIPSFNNYIKTGKNLKKTIELGKIESILIDNTNYLELLKIYPQIDAIDMASIEYIEKYGNSNRLISNYLNDIVTLKF